MNRITIVNYMLWICSVLFGNITALPQISTVTPIPPPGFPRPGLPLPGQLPHGSFQPGNYVPIVQQNFDISPDGTYTFGYQSADGSSRQENGGLKYSNAPGVEPILAVQGSYTYVLPDGQQVEVQYIADENGFQPSGPSIHPAILKAVAYQVAEARGQPPVPPSNGPVGFTPFPPQYSTPTPQIRTNLK